MKYYQVYFYSVEWCGYSAYGVFKANSEEELFESKPFLNFQDEFQDYVSGWMDEEDYEENEMTDAINCDVIELDENEYNELKVFYKDDENPYHIG